MNRFLLTTLFLITSVMLNAQSQALPEKLVQRQLLQQHKNIYLPKIGNNNIKAKPTSGTLELIAHTWGFFEDSVYNYNGFDSVRIYWYDSAGVDFDYIDYLSAYPAFTYVSPTPRKAFEKRFFAFQVDSMFYYEYNDTNAKFEDSPFGKETMEFLQIGGNLHYHSLGYYENNNFVEQDVYEYKYDKNNRLQERIHWLKSGLSFNITGKDSFGFDNTGNLLYQSYLSKNSNDFETENEIVYTYTANGLLTSTAHIFKNDTTLILDTTEMYHYSYTANDELSIETKRIFNGTELVNNRMKIYNYTGNLLSEIVEYKWDTLNNTFDTAHKYELLYSSATFPFSVTEYLYYNHSWEELLKYENYYNANDNLDSVMFFINNGSGLERNSITYYKRNSEDLVETYQFKSIWDDNDSTWKSDNGDFILNMYYDTLQVDTTINITNIVSDNAITIYPNPTNTVINIRVANSNLNAIHIYDNSGRIIQQITMHQKTNNTTLDLSNLSDGLYNIMIATEKQTTIKKVIVQH